MWSCLCGVRLPVMQFPVHCSCGAVGYEDGTILSPIDCAKRGPVVGKINCGCEGDTRVFECKVHKYCALRKLKPGPQKVVLHSGEEFDLDPPTCNVCTERVP